MPSLFDDVDAEAYARLVRLAESDAPPPPPPGGIDRRRRAARGGAEPLPELRAVGHHLARAARRARRAEAGAAPHPVHDVAAEPDRRRQAPQVREGRRRRDGELPPARRRGALRDARAHGAAVLAALSARRRLRQLRLARRRQRRGDALHGMPPRAHRPTRCSRRSISARCHFRPNYDGTKTEPVVLPARHSEPADQRRHRDRGRHGDQHPAAQPRRESARRSSSCSTTRI